MGNHHCETEMVNIPQSHKNTKKNRRKRKTLEKGILIILVLLRCLFLPKDAMCLLHLRPKTKGRRNEQFLIHFTGCWCWCSVCLLCNRIVLCMRDEERKHDKKLKQENFHETQFLVLSFFICSLENFCRISSDSSGETTHKSLLGRDAAWCMNRTKQHKFT